MYTSGEIINDWTINANIKQLDKNKSLTNIDKKTNIIEIITEVYLKNILLFLLIIGLLTVSAGAFLKNNSINIIPTKLFIKLLIIMYLHIIGTNINIMLEVNKHIQLLVACNPNENVLIIL